jgi:hypothetical protein
LRVICGFGTLAIPNSQSTPGWLGGSLVMRANMTPTPDLGLVSLEIPKQMD